MKNKITKHPFVATPDKGKCGSCGYQKKHPVHGYTETNGRRVNDSNKRARAARRVLRELVSALKSATDEWPPDIDTAIRKAKALI